MNNKHAQEFQTLRNRILINKIGDLLESLEEWDLLHTMEMYYYHLSIEDTLPTSALNTTAKMCEVDAYTVTRRMRKIGRLCKLNNINYES